MIGDRMTLFDPVEELCLFASKETLARCASPVPVVTVMEEIYSLGRSGFYTASGIMGSHVTQLSPSLCPCLYVLQEELRELRQQPIDPQAEQEIIDSIEEVYFSNDSFDMVRHELEKLPPELNLQELEEYRDKLKRQQAAVSKRVADLILEKQPSYVK
ncbi:hypothetical protein ATANTOWER_000468, partial [Ataeniobius toweri]|nr:hypothetical protein [Ataeniobius toweri]